jgi:Dockerin type I domain/Calx-beta domain
MSNRRPNQRRRLFAQMLESRSMLAGDLAANVSSETEMAAPAVTFDATDCNRDGETNTLDALYVVNSLRRGKADINLDANRDGKVTPLDALSVINSVRKSNSARVAASLKGEDSLSILPPIPLVSIRAADAVAAETVAGDPENLGVFVIERSGPTDRALVVNLEVGGTATNGTDYASIPDHIEIPAGAEAIRLAVKPIDDATPEITESVIVAISPPILPAVVGIIPPYAVAPESGRAGVRIEDNDGLSITPIVGIRAVDPRASEVSPNQERPEDPGTFEIFRSGPTDGALTVWYKVGGTATNGVDYAEIRDRIEIPAGAESARLPIVVIDDNLVEGRENVVVELTDPTDVQFILPPYLISPGAARAEVVIEDNDVVGVPVVSIRATDPEAREISPLVAIPPDSGLFEVRRTGPTTASLFVSYSIHGSATNGVDYQEIKGLVEIPAGSEVARISIDVIDDQLVEGAETVSLTIDPPIIPAVVGAVPPYQVATGGSRARVVIADNDTLPPPPTVSIRAADEQAAETNAAQEPNPGVFVVSRTGSTDGALRVFVHFGGSATNGADYRELDRLVEIPVGMEAVRVVVNPLDDAHFERTESVIATLAPSPVADPNTIPTGGYRINPNAAHATVLIADNDQQNLPVVSIYSVDSLANEPHGERINRGRIRVRRTGPTEHALFVRYEIGGSATNGVDYRELSGVIEIPAGRRWADLIVAPIDDDLFEFPEIVDIRLLGNPAEAANSLPGYLVDPMRPKGFVVIRDNDTRPPNPPQPVPLAASATLDGTVD